MQTASRDFLFEGTVRAVAHSAQLAMDALMLLDGGRRSSAYVLIVMAREELGRATMLWKEASKLANGATLIQQELGELAHKLRNHVLKLGEGQTMFHDPSLSGLANRMQHARASNDEMALGECYAEMASTIEAARARDSKSTHEQRMRAQYVNLEVAGPAWSNPAEIRFDEVRNLLSTVSCEIVNALGGAATNSDAMAASVRCGVCLPSAQQFHTEVIDRVFFSDPLERSPSDGL